MQGVLYYPSIAVPRSAWFTRALLYWDDVGTIVPREYAYRPELLPKSTAMLVGEGLVRQVFADDANSLAASFTGFLRHLSEEEKRCRRQRFEDGRVTNVHADKFLMAAAGLAETQDMGLAQLPRGAGRGEDLWIALESTTAAEFMAALALALCAPGLYWQRDDQGNEQRWVPITDRTAAARALTSGLIADDDGAPANRELQLRVEGHMKTAEVRSVVLQRLLPVPEGNFPVERIIAHRRRYGALLPQLRRFLEERVDQLIAIDDEAMRLRLLDRLADEAEERLVQAEAYLRESGARRVGRSSLLRFLKVVPSISGVVGGVQDLAGGQLAQPDFAREPLAYLAFARREFAPPSRYRIDPFTGVPLAEAMSRRA